MSNDVSNKVSNKVSNNYTVYHLHSDLSLLDSATKYEDYVKRASELGQTSLASTEHGVIYNWVHKKELCDKYNIKYIHGVEIYLTAYLEPKIRDNYHTVLLAKNREGVKEINRLVSLSNQKDHFYFKPRITFNEFLNISDNVITTSACLASPLNAPEIINQKDIYLQLLNKYTYLEVQPHNSKRQKDFNNLLYKLSMNYNKPLIAGTDTHSLNQYKAECRTLLQLSKNINFTDEDTYDLTYKTYDELKNMFKEQNILPEEVYMEAIENTNVMAQSVDNFELDKTTKYPYLYDDDESVFKKRVVERFDEKIKNHIIPENEIEQFTKNIKEEFDTFKATNMLGFMLSMSELIEWCHNNDIPTGFGRGSVVGSSLAYILNIIDVDPVKFNTIFSRFCNKNRVEMGDVDVDFPPEMRDKVYNHIFNQFGYDRCAYVLALGTISDKGCIDDIGRGLKDENGNRKYSLEEITTIKDLYSINPEQTKKQYSDIFYYFDGLLNTYVSQSMHPAGIIISPVKLKEEYGIFFNDDLQILQLDMEDSHNVNLVKYDILGLKTVTIINDACKLAGIPYPKSNEIDWEDENVYREIKECPVGLFQMESSFAWDSIKKFDCHSINDLSLVNACIRPSGESYRDQLLNHIQHKNPSEEIDNLLSDTLGFLVYQEQTIKFMQDICGLNGADADSVRRAIGKKDKDYIDKMLPIILDGYCKHSNKNKEESEKEALEFIQVIQDSSSYSFGYNHSIAYSMLGYVCGWLRHYYPYEFITAYLNNAQNQDDINNGTLLIKDKNIQLKSAQFRHSKYNYYFDKNTNTIYKGTGSIKFLNEDCANELYEIGKDFNGTFKELLDKLNVSNVKQVKILILLDYFIEFGGSKKLLNYYNKYLQLKGRTQFKKEEDIKIDTDEFKSGDKSDNSLISIQYPEIKVDDLLPYFNNSTKKLYKDFNFNLYMNDEWEKEEDTEFPLDVLLKAQMYFIGNISYINDKLANVYVVISFKTYGDKTTQPYVTLYDLHNGEQIKTKVTSGIYYVSAPFFINSIIQINKWKEVRIKEKYIDNGKIRYRDTDKTMNAMEDWIVIK